MYNTNYNDLILNRQQLEVQKSLCMELNAEKIQQLQEIKTLENGAFEARRSFEKQQLKIKEAEKETKDKMKMITKLVKSQDKMRDKIVELGGVDALQSFRKDDSTSEYSEENYGRSKTKGRGRVQFDDEGS